MTGNFTGTTDEIIQWAACKWGIDEDLVRAQIAVESWWDQRAGGDLTSTQSNCHPDVRTTTGQCPESFGLLQVRYLYHASAFVDDERDPVIGVQRRLHVRGVAFLLRRRAHVAQHRRARR